MSNACWLRLELRIRQISDGSPHQEQNANRFAAASRDLTRRLNSKVSLGLLAERARSNGLILGYLMYKSGLVPRRMAMIGLVGGPVLILSHILIV